MNAQCKLELTENVDNKVSYVINYYRNKNGINIFVLQES